MGGYDHNKDIKIVPADSVVSSCSHNKGELYIGRGSTVSKCHHNAKLIVIGESSTIQSIKHNRSNIEIGDNSVVGRISYNSGTIKLGVNCKVGMLKHNSGNIYGCDGTIMPDLTGRHNRGHIVIASSAREFFEISQSGNSTANYSGSLDAARFMTMTMSPLASTVSPIPSAPIFNRQIQPFQAAQNKQIQAVPTQNRQIPLVPVPVPIQHSQTRQVVPVPTQNAQMQVVPLQFPTPHHQIQSTPIGNDPIASAPVLKKRKAPEPPTLRNPTQSPEDPEIGFCSICMEYPRDVAFSCGHLCCERCAEPLTVCHMCRKDISQKIKLFI